MPAARIELDDECVDRDGFLAFHRTRISLNGSATVAYDFVSRRALDSSVIAAHFARDGVRYVYLRSAVRPPLVLRGLEGSLWELPAGLIEPGESPSQAAKRELLEELGFDVGEPALLQLGASMFPAPAVKAEVQHFFSVAVNPADALEPEGDGSPFEALSLICAISFDDVRALLRQGAFRDSKTELGLRRLLETA